jgi:hypothetical protein
MADPNFGASVNSEDFVFGEYGMNKGNAVGVGNGWENGASNVAPAFSGPVLIRVNENGGPVTDEADATPVGRE